jgi:hypothetical protein
VDFDRFVDAVEERLQAGISHNYGLYRGPFVAYWHFGDRTARLRSGETGDVLLDGDCAVPVRAGCDDASIDAIVAHLAAFMAED